MHRDDADDGPFAGSLAERLDHCNSENLRMGLEERGEIFLFIGNPAILGGQLLETWKILSHTPDTRITIASPCYIAGFLVSFIVGTLSVRFIFWIYEKGNVRPFAWYCLAIGILTAWAL